MKPGKSYYAVIFSSSLNPDSEGYQDMAADMQELAKKQPGYMGFESAREDIGISVSYWESLDAIAAWKANLKHQLAQSLGRKEWYQWYKVRICEVRSEYDFKRE